MPWRGTTVTGRRSNGSARSVGGLQVGVLEDRPQHAAHLELRERRAEAAAHAAAERDPRVGRGRSSPRKRSGRNACGSGNRSSRWWSRWTDANTAVPARSVPAGVSSGSPSRRPTSCTVGRMRSVSSTTASRYSSPSASDASQPREHLGAAEEPVERPRQRGRGRLVAGEQERDELVAQLVLVQRRAVLVARLDEHREDVVALVEVRRGLALADLLVEHGVHPPHRAVERGVRLPAASASTTATCVCAFVVRTSTSSMRRRSSSSRAPACVPNTARRITSRVIDCIRGWSANGSPTGHARCRAA